MRQRLMLVLSVVVACSAATVATVALASPDERKKPDHKKGYEVWTIDQSDTRADGGGNLYVYDGPELADKPGSAVPETIDLGGEARDMCMEQTGSAPRRPHMVVFNGGNSSVDGNGRAAIAFVVSGHVLFMDADTRKPVKCIDTGVQAHAVWPTPDQRQIIVANQNDKKLSRISTDYDSDEYELEPAATLDLANGTTPSGAPRQSPELRPDNAPICPRTDDEGKRTFVTLRGGGMFVVDHRQTPMRIVAEYDKTNVDENGCGEIQAGDKMYVNSGAGALATNPDNHDVYAFDVDDFGGRPNPPNVPAPKLVYSYDGRTGVDSHGVLLTKGERYLWTGDRQANTISVVDSRRDKLINEFSIAQNSSSDPAPDLMDISPDGKTVFASLRGPFPQSGGHASVGNTPGVGVIDVRRGGRDGRMKGVAKISNPTTSVESADPHAIRLRVLGGGPGRDDDERRHGR